MSTLLRTAEQRRTTLTTERWRAALEWLDQPDDPAAIARVLVGAVRRGGERATELAVWVANRVVEDSRVRLLAAAILAGDFRWEEARSILPPDTDVPSSYRSLSRTVGWTLGTGPEDVDRSHSDAKAHELVGIVGLNSEAWQDAVVREEVHRRFCSTMASSPRIASSCAVARVVADRLNGARSNPCEAPRDAIAQARSTHVQGVRRLMMGDVSNARSCFEESSRSSSSVSRVSRWRLALLLVQDPETAGRGIELLDSCQNLTVEPELGARARIRALQALKRSRDALRFLREHRRTLVHSDELEALLHSSRALELLQAGEPFEAWEQFRAVAVPLRRKDIDTIIRIECARRHLAVGDRETALAWLKNTEESTCIRAGGAFVLAGCLYLNERRLSAALARVLLGMQCSRAKALVLAFAVRRRTPCDISEIARERSSDVQRALEAARQGDARRLAIAWRGAEWEYELLGLAPTSTIVQATVHRLASGDFAVLRDWSQELERRNLTTEERVRIAWAQAAGRLRFGQVNQAGHAMLRARTFAEANRCAALAVHARSLLDQLDDLLGDPPMVNLSNRLRENPLTPDGKSLLAIRCPATNLDDEVKLLRHSAVYWHTMAFEALRLGEPFEDAFLRAHECWRRLAAEPRVPEAIIREILAASGRAADLGVASRALALFLDACVALHAIEARAYVETEPELARAHISILRRSALGSRHRMDIENLHEDVIFAAASARNFEERSAARSRLQRHAKADPWSRKIANAHASLLIVDVTDLMIRNEMEQARRVLAEALPKINPTGSSALSDALSSVNLQQQQGGVSASGVSVIELEILRIYLTEGYASAYEQSIKLSKSLIASSSLVASLTAKYEELVEDVERGQKALGERTRGASYFEIVAAGVLEDEASVFRRGIEIAGLAPSWLRAALRSALKRCASRTCVPKVERVIK